MSSKGPVFAPLPCETNFKLHIAIDFGTDGVGVAYAIDDKVFIHSKWKSRKHGNAIKPKTIILLDDQGETVAFGIDAKYNYMTLSSSKRNEWMLFERFKMTLFSGPGAKQSQDLKENEHKMDIATKLTAANGEPCSSETVFVAAFKHIHAETKKFLKKQKIKNISNKQVEWIITVPVIWSDESKYRMKLWMTKAGLIDPKIKDQCRIVYEPDCASLSIQYEIQRQRNHAIDEEKHIHNDNPAAGNKNKIKPKINFKKGHKYILVDAGGGTVDIVCHELVGENGEFGVKEILIPSGGPWGSSYIDDKYIKLLENIFTKDWMDEFKNAQPNVYTEIIDQFQKSKETFFQIESDSHNCELPYDFLNFIEEKVDEMFVDDDMDVEDIVKNSMVIGKTNLICLNEEYLTIDAAVWSWLFDHVIDPVVDHIHALLNEAKLMRNCKYLCLVGGLSCSLYFQHRMRTEFGRKSKYKLKLIIPKRPMLAVVEGAALFGITKNYIKARVLRYTYGIFGTLDIDKAKRRKVPDDYIEKNKYYCTTRKKWMVRNVFVVMARKGNTVYTGQIFVRRKNRFPGKKFSRVEILCSDKVHPISADDGNSLGYVKVYYGESGTKKVNKINIEFHFYDTMIKVYAYPEGKPEIKQEMELEYNDVKSVDKNNDYV